MLEELKKIYEDNCNWLTYAELKNGALITLAGVVVGFISGSGLGITLKTLLEVLGIIVIIISGISFIPFLNSSKCIRKLCKKHYIRKKYYNSLVAKNVVFYVSIFLSTKDDYKKAVLETIPHGENYTFNKLELNYIEQIYQISTIAAIKYYLFNIAAGLFGCMLAVFICLLICA